MRKKEEQHIYLELLLLLSVGKLNSVALTSILLVENNLGYLAWWYDGQIHLYTIYSPLFLSLFFTNFFGKRTLTSQ